MASRALLVGLVCLTLGKLAYYSVELAVKPAPVATSARTKTAPPTAREALNYVAGEGKSDRLR